MRQLFDLFWKLHNLLRAAWQGILVQVKTAAEKELARTFLSPPWDTLKEHLEVDGTSVKKFRLLTGISRKEMRAIRKGKVITPEVAKKIATFWEEEHRESMTRFWLKRDANHQKEKRNLSR